MSEERCSCGEPLHYLTDRSRAFVEALIAAKGPSQKVDVVGLGSWMVPRHYIALHGIHGCDVPGLAARYGWPAALGTCTMCGQAEATLDKWAAPVCADCDRWLTGLHDDLDAMEKADPGLGRLAGEIADSARHTNEDPERQWDQTLSCGHTQRVSTVIGDFNFEAHHSGLPVLCSTCRYDLGRPLPDCFVELVSVRAVPREEWDD